MTEPTPRRHTVGRTIAFAIGLFTLLNSVGELVRDGFDANLWWLDPPWRDRWTRAVFFAVTGGALVLNAVRPPESQAWRVVGRLFVVGLIAIATWNVFTYYRLLDSSTVRSTIPIPFSLVVAILLIPVFLSLDARPRERWRHRDRAASLILLTFLGLFFPLAQMVCFGKTDYRRPADAIVVFGAGVWADGEPSLALRDRMGTAIALYHEGLAVSLIVSGGPGRGEVHETEAMTKLAVDAGVPRERIFIDPAGLDSWETVRNVTPTLDALGADRVLAVSHFYHLPRVKMAFHRAGREVFTVPATETRRLRKLPYYMLREVIAFWVYYLRPLTGR